MFSSERFLNIEIVEGTTTMPCVYGCACDLESLGVSSFPKGHCVVRTLTDCSGFTLSMFF